MSQKIIIVDYGMGNFGSIHNMLKHIGIKSIITNNLDAIETADKLILAGVGAFDNGMSKLKELKLLEILKKKSFEDRVPVLGICIGMQLFSKKSEEGEIPGLGWFEADTVRFKFNHDSSKLKIPHMGWNVVYACKKSKLFNDMYDEPRFYFVHSFHLKCKIESDILCTTNYGYDFVSAIERDNIYGVQFHPEKSHKYGMRLLENFANLSR